MKFKAEIFSQEEIEMVHQKTMDLLETTGVWVKSRKAFQLMKEAGARVSEDKMIVYLTEDRVMEAVRWAPKKFVLAGRNPKYDYEIPSYESRHLMSGICTNIYDPYTGELRPSTKDDVRNVGRVFQKTVTGVAAWTGCSALDVPEQTHCLHEMAAIIQGTSKHVQFELSNTMEAEYAKKILDLAAGSKEAFLERKIASVLYCPVSPMTHVENMLEAYLQLSDYEIPVNIYPMPMIGLTSPASLFSTIVQINAEVLSGLTIFQTARPGWPVIYGVASGAADARTGFYVKSGEAPLISLGGTAMARYYGLPCCVTGGGTFETMPAYLGGADLIDGIGTCDNGMAVSLEMILTEDEIGQRILRICRGIRINDRTDLVDEIKEEGPGGAFLVHRSTLRNFRDKDELYTSPYFPSKLRGTVHEKADSIAIANKMVREILEGPVEDALPADVTAVMDRICAEADAAAGSGGID
ncbi:MAG TPA: trimethylamine methyltransferase family protein [Anaerovoracaceae bacterium]|nr:trimethylamine methyltransferase family protein [Anaerovoracaceae bacterium]